MKKLIYVCALVAVFSCDKPADPSAVSPADLKSLSFKQNVALFDARIRAVESNGFVKELVFADFSEKGVLGDAVVFEGEPFTDNGKQFDAKAGDGIFTAVEKSAYNASVTAESLIGLQPKSLLEAPVVDAAFGRSAELLAYQATHDRYPSGLANARMEQVVVCDVTFGGTGCRAQRWGLCESCCIVFSNCRIIFPAW